MYQINPPPKNQLLTMYDLPSENPEDLGLPDVFHDLQPELLRWTFQTPNYDESEIFIASDLNLYYDVEHPQWYKRPDWFVVLGVPRLYQNKDLRLSYVIWDEKISPFLAIELLSEGTEKEDLGQTLREVNQPPTKWEVYEKILKIPYYVVFDRSGSRLQCFQLKRGKYREIKLTEPRIWFKEINLGIGIWEGAYQGIYHQWLRCYDEQHNWIPTPEERAITAEQEVIRLRQLLQQSGINLETN